MKRSTERFLTTHTGSLPRPEDLIRMMYAKEEGVPVDPQALRPRVRAAVAEVVKKQADAGVDLINDGELSKPSYATYIKDRLNGVRRHRQHVRLSGPRGISGARQESVRRSRTLAPQDTGLQRADQRAGSAGGARRRRQSQGRAGTGEAQRRLHERRLAGRGVAVLPQRPLQGLRDLHLRDRRRDARRIRDRGEGRLRAAVRLSGPRHGPPHPIRRPRPQGISQAHHAAYRGAQLRGEKRSRRATPHASVLGQLRRSASSRRAVDRHHRHRVPGEAASPFRSKAPTRGTITNGRCSRP